MLGLLPERLAFLLAVDPAEADAFRVLVVQDFDGVAVEGRDNLAAELASEGRAGKQKREEDGPEAAHGSNTYERIAIGDSVGCGFGSGVNPSIRFPRPYVLESVHSFAN